MAREVIGNITPRSASGEVIDALGNTATFVYRVLVLHKKGGNFISYRGAYEMKGGSEGVSFIERYAGRSPHDINSRDLRWETPERAQYVLTQAQIVGFTVAEEGSFVYTKDVTAEELAKHLDFVQNGKTRTT